MIANNSKRKPVIYRVVANGIAIKKAIRIPRTKQAVSLIIVKLRSFTP